MKRFLSVVVPMYNEELNVAPLVNNVTDALQRAFEWELVLVDDGSTDETASEIAKAAGRDDRIRLVRLARNYGQSAAMQAGFDAAEGEVVVTMDGDLQNDPRDIPALIETLDRGYDLVTGYRVNRQDRLLTRKLPSWIANRLIRMITRVDVRDNGCSLKAYRADLLERLHLYSDMHRFIPAVAAGTAGARITEVPVRHFARRYGSSKYGLDRVAKVLADLITVMMIRSFRRKPLAMFALGAFLSAGIGLVLLSLNLFVWLAGGTVGRFVYSGAAMLFFFLATFLFFTGLIAETALGEIGQTQEADILVREVP